MNMTCPQIFNTDVLLIINIGENKIHYFTFYLGLPQTKLSGNFALGLRQQRWNLSFGSLYHAIVSRLLSH